MLYLETTSSVDSECHSAPAPFASQDRKSVVLFSKCDQAQQLKPRAWNGVGLSVTRTNSIRLTRGQYPIQLPPTGHAARSPKSTPTTIASPTTSDAMIVGRRVAEMMPARNTRQRRGRPIGPTRAVAKNPGATPTPKPSLTVGLLVSSVPALAPTVPTLAASSPALVASVPALVASVRLLVPTVPTLAPSNLALVVSVPALAPSVPALVASVGSYRTWVRAILRTVPGQT
jgi:hypothetical protein